MDGNWDKHNLRGNASGAELWTIPRKKREGWATRSLVVMDGPFISQSSGFSGCGKAGSP